MEGKGRFGVMVEWWIGSLRTFPGLVFCCFSVPLRDCVWQPHKVWIRPCGVHQYNVEGWGVGVVCWCPMHAYLHFAPQYVCMGASSSSNNFCQKIFWWVLWHAYAYSCVSVCCGCLQGAPVWPTLCSVQSAHCRRVVCCLTPAATLFAHHGTALRSEIEGRVRFNRVCRQLCVPQAWRFAERFTSVSRQHGGKEHGCLHSLVSVIVRLFSIGSSRNSLSAGCGHLLLPRIAHIVELQCTAAMRMRFTHLRAVRVSSAAH
jgi:hypothetical protein